MNEDQFLRSKIIRDIKILKDRVYAIIANRLTAGAEDVPEKSSRAISLARIEESVEIAFVAGSTAFISLFVSDRRRQCRREAVSPSPATGPRFRAD